MVFEFKHNEISQLLINTIYYTPKVKSLPPPIFEKLLPSPLKGEGELNVKCDEYSRTPQGREPSPHLQVH